MIQRPTLYGSEVTNAYLSNKEPLIIAWLIKHRHFENSLYNIKSLHADLIFACQYALNGYEVAKNLDKLLYCNSTKNNWAPDDSLIELFTDIKKQRDAIFFTILKQWVIDNKISMLYKRGQRIKYKQQGCTKASTGVISRVVFDTGYYVVEPDNNESASKTEKNVYIRCEDVVDVIESSSLNV